MQDLTAKTKNRRLVIVGFSLTDFYRKHDVLRFVENYEKVLVICPHEQVFYYRLLHMLKNIKRVFSEGPTSILLKTKAILTKGPHNANLSTEAKTYASIESIEDILKSNKGESVTSFPTSSAFRLRLVVGYKLNRKLKELLDSDGGELFVDGVDAAPYLLDTLQRYGYRYKINRYRTVLNSINSTFYLSTFLTYIASLRSTMAYNVNACLINHDVYMESGFIGEWLKKNYGAKVFLRAKGMQEPVEIDPPEKWLKNELQSQVRPEFSPSAPNFNEKAKYLSALGDLRHQVIEPDRVLIVMHAFSDANSLHFSKGSIFTSYYQWIRETLDLARRNLNIRFCFRIHPDSYTIYRKDMKLINDLFKSPPKNVVLENPYFPQQHFRGKSPIVVTGRGNISRECAIAGFKAICIAEPNCPEGGYLQVQSINEYAYWLSGQCETKVLRVSHSVVGDAKTMDRQYKDWVERRRLDKPDEILVSN